MPHSRSTTLNIITTDYSIVCRDHYETMRRRMRWPQLRPTRDECEICPFERSCGGPAFCLDKDCAFCNSL